MRKNLVALALLLTMIVSTLAVMPSALSGNPGPPPGGVSMWIQPDTISYETGNPPAGYMFKVYVWCEIPSGVSTYSWQIYLTYNKAHLNATNAGYFGLGGMEYPPNTGKSEWANGYSTAVMAPSYGSHNATLNYVLIAESLQGDVEQATPGVYRLAWIQFKIIGFPAKYETLTSELRLDIVGLFKSKFEDPAGSLLPLAFGKATYSFTWTAPAKPDVAVDPVETRFAKEPPSSVGKTFNVDIAIKNLDPAWGLHNASFDLYYDDTLIGIVAYTVDPLWGMYVFDNSTAGLVHVEVKNPTGTPGGASVKMVTITFIVLYQGVYPAVDISPLNLENVHLFDTLAEIDKTVIDGRVVIEGLLTLPMPYLEVSSVTMGPEYVVGQEFNVTVSIKNLHWAWYFIGLNFRLSYDPALIKPVAINEGPFLPYWASQQPGSLGTWWYGEDWPTDPRYGPHILVGSIIYPNATGYWNPPWPTAPGPDVLEGLDAPVAIITFKVVYQPSGLGENTTQLSIIQQKMVGLDGPVTQNILRIALAPPVNGTYTIKWNMMVGRLIDLYGGAVNEGYGALPFPAPYGGQGSNNPMDLVTPQSWVQLYANVTYNGWPVQSKTVSFEVQYPNGDVFAKLTDITDVNGVATVGFRMPWPCENPESLFGVWKVIATVSIADVVVNDTMEFHYDYMVRLWKVTTDKYEYEHGETVTITIEYGTHAMRSYPLLITVVIKDDLGVPIGIATAEGTVGGAQFCKYKNSTITRTIVIPKWAYAGVATVHVNAFDKEPADGGFAWCPEYTPTPKIVILPQ